MKVLKTCKKGHRFYKSSNCLSCPECEKEKKPNTGFLSVISAPARRALEQQGISTLLQLSRFSEKQLLDLHGMGPSAILTLRQELKKSGLNFSKSSIKHGQG